ncbi:zinc-finger domain-containing protein [Halalkalibacterium ligniniphilum]|uniref:zinc-finger domain-containing protein n=1 Tax=Halalkalibacterium ligniniphilum TaxID=1134413 RepID=UPI00035D28AB|nr:zinc-finger domain-containing protein [Halalkalibacterium ligniniphilum]
MKRIDVIKQINIIKDTYCEQCPFQTYENPADCARCKHYAELNRCGAMLTKISKERRRKKSPNNKRGQELSKRDYTKLKKLKCTDKEIASMYGIGMTKFMQKKYSWGIAKKKGGE